jgi:hypothetical protein
MSTIATRSTASPPPPRCSISDVLVTPYGRSGPQLLIELSTEARTVSVLALLDSGAARSMFPRSVARMLGIEDELVSDPVGAVGVEGAGFPTWSYPLGMAAQVMRTPPEDPSRSEPWGTSVRMTPAFADKGVFLLGREDFFLGFTITFERGRAGPQFALAT